jgi:hypothetical protein
MSHLPMSQMMLALSLGFGGVILATQIGFANPQCAPRAEVIEGLAQTYGETRRSLGIAANTTVMELFAADATGTWTLTITLPDGTTCLLASGQGYEAIIEAQPPKGNKV